MNAPLKAHAIEDLLVHSSWLRTLALRLLRDVAEAEEFVQETWLKALAKPPRKDIPIQPWLARVLRNAICEDRRGRGRRREREHRAAREEALPSTSEIVSDFENQTVLAQLVLGLDEPYKSSVLLRYYEGLPAVEIARRMDIPAGTARWRISEGLSRLKDELDRHHEGNRLAWCSAFAPLAGVDRTATASAAGATAGATAGAIAGATAFTLGILTMKPLLSIGVALLGVLIYTLIADPFAIGSGAEAPEVFEQAAANSSGAESPDGTESTQYTTAERALAATRQAVLAPESKLHIIGRTIDEYGSAIPEAQATFLAKEERSTDSEGGFEFDVDRPRYFGNHSIRISAAGYATTRVPFVVKADGSELDLDLGDIVLAPGGVVTGWVRDASGVGLEGAEVLALSPSSTNSESHFAKKHTHSALAHVRSDAAGRFVLSGVPVGFVDIWAQQATLFSDCRRGVTVEKRSETADISLTLREIPSGSTVAGIVLDPDGEPVPYARLKIIQLLKHGGATHSMNADAEGRFLFEEELDRPITIVASSAQRSRAKLKHHRAMVERVEPGTRDLVLQLAKPRWIEIIAYDEQGHVVPVDRVVSASHHPIANGGRTTTFDEPHVKQAENSISIACPGRRFELLIEKTGYQTLETGSMEPADVGARIEVMLERLLTLRGNVTRNDEPVAGVLLQLYTVVPSYADYAIERFPLLWQKEDSKGTITNANGRFSLPFLPEKPNHGQLNHGRTFVLRASKVGFAPTFSQEFSLDAAPYPEELTIDLPVGGSIQGRVLLPGGASPRGTFIGVSNGDGELKAQRVGADGVFSFDHLTPGGWLVQRMETEYGFGDGMGGGGTNSTQELAPVSWSCQVKDAKVTKFDLDLRLPTRAQLRGKVLVDGKGPGPWRASLTALSRRSRHLDAWIPKATSLDPNGAFELAGAPPGDYLLMIVAPGRSGIRMVQKLRLTVGDQSVHTELTLAPLSGRLESKLDGKDLLHVHETPGGTSIRTPIHTSATGTFELRVPVGKGAIVTGPSLRMELPAPLRKLDIPPSGARAVLLD